MRKKNISHDRLKISERAEIINMFGLMRWIETAGLIETGNR